MYFYGEAMEQNNNEVNPVKKYSEASSETNNGKQLKA